MRILLTNDDGIESEGIRALRDILDQDHDVWVFAPDGERSAMSHYITVKGPVRCSRVGPSATACSGSPADCVILSHLGAVPFSPEIVISGINRGPNLGSDIIYSGTAAAARQAALQGTPGIAVSLNAHEDPFHFENAAAFVSEHLAMLVRLWNEHHFININIPNSPIRHDEVEITTPCNRRYTDRLSRFNAPNGDEYFFVDGEPLAGDLLPGTDWHAVHSGVVSISPIFLNPVNHEDDEPYRSALFSRAGA